MKNNPLLILLGGAVGGVAIYYLIKKLEEGTTPSGENLPPSTTNGQTFYEEIAIHYAHPDDAFIAYRLRDELKRRGWINTQTIYLSGVNSTAYTLLNRLASFQVAITIGGQIVNPLYADAASRGIVEELDGVKMDWGVDNLEGPGNLMSIYYVAGYSTSDTNIVVDKFLNEVPIFN